MFRLIVPSRRWKGSFFMGGETTRIQYLIADGWWLKHWLPLLGPSSVSVVPLLVNGSPFTRDTFNSILSNDEFSLAEGRKKRTPPRAGKVQKSTEWKNSFTYFTRFEKGWLPFVRITSYYKMLNEGRSFGVILRYN